MRRAVVQQNDGGRKSESSSSDLEEENDDDPEPDPRAVGLTRRRNCRWSQGDIWGNEVCNGEKREEILVALGCRNSGYAIE